jgi:hypothetical protein
MKNKHMRQNIFFQCTLGARYQQAKSVVRKQSCILKNETLAHSLPLVGGGHFSLLGDILKPKINFFFG